MSRKSSFFYVKSYIESDLKQSGFAAFTERQLMSFLEEGFERWPLKLTKEPWSYKTQFINWLTDSKLLQKISLFNESGEEKILYKTNTEDLFSVFINIKRRGYYTHYSAMYLHGLTLQIPKVFYINSERYDKTNFGTKSLLQKNIDLAFSHSQRKSNTFYSFKGRKVFVLNGVKTNRLGVITYMNKELPYSTTDLERTLIDIVVRPAYSGGVFEVLGAFARASQHIDLDKLFRYLELLNFIYPYRQAVGFYLHKSGFPIEKLSSFQKDMKYDFYLTYNIKNIEYSEDWKLYYPKGF